MNLLPADQAHYAAPKNSGGSTNLKDITIEGHTMPGQHRARGQQQGLLQVGRRRRRDRRQRQLHGQREEHEGVNTYNFLVIDPFGRQLIRSYPVFWIPFAAPGSTTRTAANYRTSCQGRRACDRVRCGLTSWP